MLDPLLLQYNDQLHYAILSLVTQEFPAALHCSYMVALYYSAEMLAQFQTFH